MFENVDGQATDAGVTGILLAHCRTGSPLARTNLSPFARCTLGLNRHFY